MKEAIVVGCNVNGLGVIRSLGLKNFRITALYYDRLDFAHASKYVFEKIIIPNPGAEEEKFVDFLIRNSGKWRDALLIETNDEALIAVSKNKEKLEKHFKIATPEWEVLRRFIEKPETYRLAEKCGVPYPKTFLPRTLDELNKIKDEIAYPCLLKPVLSHEFMSTFKSKNFEVSNSDELLMKFRLCQRSGHEVMMQEIIPGPDSNIFQCLMYISSNGNSNAAFLDRKIRQNPPKFGVARVAISEDAIPQIRKFTERMLKEGGFRGVAHSEFKKDPRDNEFKLMEINGRTSRSNWLATYCGVNLPWITYMDLVEKEQIEVTDYKKGVYWIELYQDVANSIFRRNKENLGLKDYVKPYLSKNKTFADMSTEDVMPFLKRISVLPMKHYMFSRSRIHSSSLI